MSWFIQTLIGGLTAGSVYAVIALGVVMIYNVSKVLNLAQGEFAVLGALLMVTLWSSWRLPLYVALPLAVAGAMVAGLALEHLLIRRMKSAPVSTLLVVTLGFSIFLRGVFMVVWGKDPLVLPSILQADIIRFHGVSVMPEVLLLWGAIALLSLLTWLFFSRTLLGKAIRACSENPDAASLSGINVWGLHRLSYMLSAGIGAIGGILFAPITFVTYDAGILLGLKGFAAALMVGVSSIGGGILAGLLLGVAEALSASYVSSVFKDATAFLLLIAVLIIRSRRAVR